MRDVALFDLDGTMWIHPSKPDFNSTKSLAQAIPNRRLGDLVNDVQKVHGVDVEFATGRGPLLRKFTEDQVRKVTRWPAPIVHMRSTDTWRGWTQYIRDKVDTCNTRRAGVYIGDADIDRKVALNAGIPFLDVREATVDLVVDAIRKGVTA